MAAALRWCSARCLVMRYSRSLRPPPPSLHLTARLHTSPPPPPPPQIANSKLGADAHKYFEDHDGSSSSSSGGGGTGESSSASESGSALATRILDAALSHVTSLGWTSAALAAGAADMGLSAQSAGEPSAAAPSQRRLTPRALV